MQRSETPGAWPRGLETPAASPRGQPLGTELLDDPRADPRAVVAELHDIARLNRLFGGTRAVVQALEPLFADNSRPRATLKDSLTVARNTQRRWTLLDVGTGAGDIPLAVQAAARRHGLSLVPIGLDVIPASARLAQRNGVHAVVGDGNVPPFAEKSVDIVIASQVLHHLPAPIAVRWIAAFDRLARRAVVLADLYRSRLAIAGIWLAAGVLARSRTTRHDAVVSLKRGYTVREFEALLAGAGVRARVLRRRWARIVAVWEPSAISRQPSTEPISLTAKG